MAPKRHSSAVAGNHLAVLFSAQLIHHIVAQLVVNGQGMTSIPTTYLLRSGKHVHKFQRLDNVFQPYIAGVCRGFRRPLHKSAFSPCHTLRIGIRIAPTRYVKTLGEASVRSTSGAIQANLQRHFSAKALYNPDDRAIPALILHKKDCVSPTIALMGVPSPNFSLRCMHTTAWNCSN